MKRLQSLAAVVLGLCALSMGMGCAGEGGDLDMADEPEVAEPGRIPLGGMPGSTGANKFNPLNFHTYRQPGYSSARQQLVTGSTKTSWLANNPSNNTLLGSEGGREWLKYAARCGVASGTTVYAQAGFMQYSFPGQGLLATTSDWLTAGLSLASTQDLFSCLLAHLNAFGVEVPINLSGPSVTNSLGSDSGFEWEEALWATKITPTAHDAYFEFYVWPLDDLTACLNYVPQLQNRVCGTYNGPCGLTVRHDRATACTETASGWYCNDASENPLPAIKTRLKETDVEVLYDNCPL